MEGENVILEEILHKIHEIKIGDYVDASDFLLKILSPSKPGEQDLLEDLRAGFRNRVIEPCFSKLEDIFQDLEKRHQSKDSQIYQLLDPLKSSDFQKYQQQVAKVLDQNLKTLKYPVASPIVSKILADPLNLVELSGLYQKKAKAVFDKQLDGLNTTIEIPKDSVQSAADTVSLGKNVKDVVPVAKNPIVNSSLENIPAEKQQADLNANNSWSIGAANNLLEKTVKEKQQANLEAEAIEVTLSEKSLKDLKELIIRGEESAKLFAHKNPKNPKNSQENVTQDSGEDSGLSITDALLAAAIAGKSLLRLGGIVYVGYEAIKAMKEKIARLNADTDAAFESAKAYGLRKESLPENKKWALDYYNSLKEQKGKSVVSTGMTSEYEASKRAAELPGPEGDAARADMLYRDNFEPEKSKSVVPAGTATIPIKTDDDIVAKLEIKMVELEQDRKISASKMTGWLNTLITSSLKEELQKSIESQTERGNEIYNIIRQLRTKKPIEEIIPSRQIPGADPQAQININRPYKVVSSPLGDTDSAKVFGKIDLEDMSKQFNKVLSPMFGRMCDILKSIDGNTTGSGNNIVNNISSTGNSSAGNSGPMQSGRDPIADFRANYWRDSSSSTRYTS